MFADVDYGSSGHYRAGRARPPIAWNHQPEQNVRSIETTQSPDQLIGTLCGALTDAAEGFEDAKKSCRKKVSCHRIHALRVATRRLTVLVKLSEAVCGTKSRKLHRRLKRLLRKTSALRDIGVQRRILTATTKSKGESDSIVRGLKQEERRLAKGIRPKLAGISVSRKLINLAHLLRNAEAKARVKKVVTRELEKARRKLLDRLSKSDDDPKHLHKTRLAVKRIRYLAEAVAPETPVAQKQWLEGLSVLQKRLGHIHDLDVLVGRLPRLLRKHGDEQGKFLLTTSRLQARRQRCVRDYRSRPSTFVQL